MSAASTGWRARWRQWRQPRAFRIGPPAWDAEQRRRLQALVAQWAPPEQETAPVPQPGDEEPGSLDEKALAIAATNLWRARRRLDRDDDGSASGRQLRKLLRSTGDALAEAGIDVQDHDGLAFDSGFALEALAFEDDHSVARETVTETVRPSVYLAGRRIQMGQVIVGQPVGAETDRGATGS
ncbi:hypothetical protein [Actinomycetospora aeridis]|uniref:Nucleotide exchange factor GrpE n=1 Tax=Actinomycetospora aeridis TaxID=3129231 RepID=A0ABU8MZ89_9PSEU